LQGYVSKHTYDKVFFFEQLPFYEQCATRRSPKEKYASIDVMLDKEYERAGYDVIRVPFMSVNERVDFILKNIGIEAL